MTAADRQRAWLQEATAGAFGRVLAGDVTAVPLCARLLDLSAACLGVRR